MCSVIGGLSESIESQLSKQPPGKLGLIMRETSTSTVIWLTAPQGVSRYLLCLLFVVLLRASFALAFEWLRAFRGPLYMVNALELAVLMHSREFLVF